MNWESFRHEPAAWLGLAWVYAALPWLVATGLLVMSLELPLAAVLAVRTALTLWIGLLLCAVDRRGWATALGTAAVEGFAALALAITLGWRMAEQGATSPSWKVIAPGVTIAESGPTLFWLVLVVIAAILNIGLLWRRQSHFDVPYRRPFTTILHHGALPAALLLAADACTVAAWIQSRS